jgi:hypothetical protein
MKTVYVVTAHNTYQGNQHSYVVGVYEDWEDAKKACLELGEDWRLPNKAEIEQLYKNYFLNGG